MTRKKTNQDPFAKREAKRYENPIPSREFILEALSASKKGLSFSALCKALGLTADEDQQALGFRLKAMCRDFQITQTRQGYKPFDESQVVEGTLSAHQDGYGFLMPDDKKRPDVYLSNREMRKGFHGDKARVAVTHTSKNGKLEGQIIAVTKHNTQQVVGRVDHSKSLPRLIAENPKILMQVVIKNHDQFSYKPDDVVVVEITDQPTLFNAPKGIIKEILGKQTDPGMEITIATRNFDIPYEWPEGVVAQIAKLKSSPTTRDKNARIDSRHLPFVTIDGEDARDFDDAVYCERKKSGGWRLFVAIADVAHYVKLNTALDTEANKRGTSVYFPKQVIPMLPEKISNGLCSLMPEVDRLCMICEMTISANGRLSGYQFYESVMHSHARLTYTDVGSMLDAKDKQHERLRKKYAHVVSHVDELYRLYHALKQQREARGAIDFETVETRMLFNSERKIESIVPIERNDAHKLIEECMLCANVATARFLAKHNLPALFRVHDGPTEKKLSALKDYLGELGLSLSGKNKPDTSDYQQLVQKIKSREDAPLIQTMLLRSMSQAKYEPDNRGHFGLAYPAYTHFTSPIRRYPDLLVHRAIKSVIRSEKPSKHVKRSDKLGPLTTKRIYPYDEEAMLALGEHCSMTERRADDATLDVENWLKCHFLTSHTGAVFQGTITAVTGFGFFVELNDIYIEGLVHISQLENDYFNADLKKQRLVGEHSRKVYALGDSLDVIVSKIELDERRIHLIPAPKAPRKRQAVKKATTEKPKKTSKSLSERDKLKKGLIKSGKKKVKPKGKPHKLPKKSSKRKK